MHKKGHKSGEAYCKTCKDYFDPDHICYMLPIVEEIHLDKSDSVKGKKYTTESVDIFLISNVHRRF